MLIDQPYHRAKLERTIEAYNRMRAERIAGTAPPGDSAMTDIRKWQAREILK